MNNLLLSELAEKDLDNIFDFSIDNWGFEKAKSYNQEIKNTLKRIQEFPDMGTVIEELGFEIRVVFVNMHSIYYLHNSKNIFILRILGSKMSPGLHL